MTAVELLQQTRHLLGEPTRWTSRCMARDAAVEQVAILSESAVAWCGAEGLFKTAGHYHPPIQPCSVPGDCPVMRVNAVLHAVAKRLYPDERGLTGVNDRYGHAAVLAVFDAAIVELGGLPVEA